jgi:phage-related protein
VNWTAVVLSEFYSDLDVIFSGNIFRLLGWVDDMGKLVLAHGFTKKTEKTPLQEI